MMMLSALLCNADLVLLIIRVGIGLIFIRHGFPKIMAGTSEWIWLGEQMKVFGITFLPIVWGLAAACTEFFGGIAFATGFMTRFAAMFLAFVMFVAFLHHINKGDSWGHMSHPLSLFIVFIAFAIGGAGIYSFDAFLSR